MGWTFPVLSLVLLLLSFVLGRALSPLHRNRFFQIVFIPGLLAATLLRLLGCYVTGAEVKKVTVFFSRESAGLSYDLQEARLLGRLIMGTFPFLVMFVSLGMIVLDQTYSPPTRWVPEELTAVNSFSEKVAQLGQILVNSCSDVVQSAPRWVWKVITGGDWRRLIGLYLIIALLVWLAPQRKESKYAVAGVAIIGLLVWLLSYLANRLKPDTGALQEQNAILSLSHLIGVLALALVASIICVRIPAYIWRVAHRGRKESRK